MENVGLQGLLARLPPDLESMILELLKIMMMTQPLNVENGESVVGKDSSTGDEDKGDNLCIRDTSTTPKKKKHVRMNEKALEGVAGKGLSTDD